MGRLQPAADARRYLDKHPLGLSPNITGLQMALAFDFDQSGQLIQSRADITTYSLIRQAPQDFRSLLPPAESSNLAPLPAPLAPRPRPADLKLDRQRDDLLTNFGKATLTDRYLLPGESFQDMFARVACAFADDIAHAQRLYDAMSQLWFMPATPVLSNGGTTRGLPISCFLNAVPDSLDGIVDDLERECLARLERRRHRHLLGPRALHRRESVKGGETSGIIPFIRVMDGLTLAISQGSLRRGSAAVYLDVHHPEIEEFLEIRKPSGDFNRKGLNLHHGINITDEFMEAVRDDAMFRAAQPEDERGAARGRCAPALAEHPRDAAADRRALSPLHRHREQRAAQAPARARA